MMVKRHSYIFIPIFLVFLSSSSVLPTLAVTRAIYILGTRHDISDSYELQLHQEVADYIKQLCLEVGYVHFPWYPAQKDWYMYAACGGSSDQALVWTIGHGYYDPPPIYGPIPVDGRYRYYIYSDDHQQGLVSWIYSNTGARRDRFVYMWHCYKGDKIYVSSSYGEHGMPWAWMHTKDLSSNGYKNPDNNGYVFIGFYNEAPFLGKNLGGVQEAGRKFVKNFYYAIFKLGNNVKQALDYAAKITFNINNNPNQFERCIFYTGYSAPSGTAYMKVYGDGNYDPTS